MIDKRELRLWNYVDYKMEDGSWQPFRVVSLHISDNGENFRPIPLTPEILEKAGWNNQEYGFVNMWHPDEAALWGIKETVSGKWLLVILIGPSSLSKFDNEFTSLHQLQNLYFALTNQELTIIL